MALRALRQMDSQTPSVYEVQAYLAHGSLSFPQKAFKASWAAEFAGLLSRTCVRPRAMAPCLRGTLGGGVYR